MKLITSLLLAAVLLAPLPFVRAASDPSPVVTLTYLGSNPTFDTDGNLISANVQAGFTSTVTVDDSRFTSQQQVSWDGADQKKVVEYDGIKCTYYQATMLIATIANQERAAQAAAKAKQ